ncbi:sugar phosphate isomerase/epimerase family protein [Natrarchaeobius oligotrophus]|uniref:Sugar phosphate isomerase/epimerase n=1 Tax=Natrarchaeobius chitinivorans TaxID=1679083 RepID=A0A3N6PSV8_NATCH|nr:sugar phosphate isomerase/epimerase [Natrarchaeobius chitinivorans]RQH02656.1 sugar phosphate isomerase/epimerase [Natrarchaeobius chitinivorans]
MGIGYTTILYDEASLEEGIADIGACRYDGVEIGLEKIRAAGPENVSAWFETHDLELYCVMSGWFESDEDVEGFADDAETVAELGAQYYGLLPPQRGGTDDETFAAWLETFCSAATDAGLVPVMHHHGATHVEQPDEIRRWLDEGPDSLELLYDTAHYYPYGDELEGIERFADDIAYVHLKDVDPGADFAEHTAALTSGEFHLDNVINYFRTFTDLGEGEIDFDAVARTLEDVGYDGHVTIEIENETERPLVHAKLNVDRWRESLAAQ